MVLSSKTLKERYGKLAPKARIQAMIEDMVDTSVIMDAVQEYGDQRYRDGERMNQSWHDFLHGLGR